MSVATAIMKLVRSLALGEWTCVQYFLKELFNELSVCEAGSPDHGWESLRPELEVIAIKVSHAVDTAWKLTDRVVAAAAAAKMLVELQRRADEIEPAPAHSRAIAAWAEAARLGALASAAAGEYVAHLWETDDLQQVDSLEEIVGDVQVESDQFFRGPALSGLFVEQRAEAARAEAEAWAEWIVPE